MDGQLHKDSASLIVSCLWEQIIRCPRLTLELTRRFPNPIPSGIHVPQWALLDVTVRYKVFLCST